MILVTGSNGYLGNNFINQYKNKYQFKKFSLLTQKLENISFDSIETVLHYAALVHQKIEYSYEKYYEINVEYPVGLAKKAKASGVKQFVFISTIAVYGEDKQLVSENTECNPVTSYGISKLEAEKQLQALEDENFTVSIIRPPMVYGKNAPGNINSLVNLVKKVPVLPLGGIKNKRSFVYVGNLCHLVDSVIGFPVELRMTGSNVFLAGDDEPLSTTRLIEIIADNIEKKVYLMKIPFFESLLKILKPSFHKRLYESLEVDTSQTKKILDFKNLYTVENGIKFMINGEM